MVFASKVWKLLVGIKDALVLAFILLVFVALYGAFTAANRAVPTEVKTGALVIRLDGALVEEPTEQDPIARAFDDAGAATGEVRTRDVVRGLRLAITDARVHGVVLDLSGFLGGGLVSLKEVAAAMDAVRAAGKPVLVYGFVLEDAGSLLAAHGSEAWLDPLGAALLPGPGGYQLYYGKLLDQLRITAHVFRVGTYKDYVEPYIRSDQSAPSRAARVALYDAIWGDLKADIAHVHPKAAIDRITRDPVSWLRAAGGDGAKAALAAGLIDHIGTKAEFGAHVAKLVGDNGGYDWRPGAYAHTSLATFLKAHDESTAGRAIGVVTIAGEIVDGKEGPGMAGSDRIAGLIDKALARDDLAALVVRIDSPGGSVTGAETIRNAILRAKAKGLPVIASMANVAASGGYWVATPASKIFVEPGTVTGSIGIFAVIPSFEKLLARYGVTGDGVRTTAISGQPDVLTGLTPEIEAMVQAEIENGYRRFVGLVAAARHKTPAAIDAVAQGRVWDGVSAQRLGLVDGFGGLDAALAAAASAAHLAPGGWHADFLETAPRQPFAALARALNRDNQDDDDDQGGSAPAGAAAQDWVGLIAARQNKALEVALSDAVGLVGGGGARAYCLACVGLSGHAGGIRPGDASPMAAGRALNAHNPALIGWLARLAAMPLIAPPGSATVTPATVTPATPPLALWPRRP